MSENSAIEWTDATWNPTTGCTKVSPACANCYIERTPPFRIRGRRFVRGIIPIEFHEERLSKPFHWREPRHVFVNSLSDLFHEAVPVEFIDRVFAVMALTRQHTYQVLTKRADRMQRYCADPGRYTRIAAVIQGTYPSRYVKRPMRWPFDNVWVGVSAENQHCADERIPLLMQTPAAVRFISAEPLLSPVNLLPFFFSHEHVANPGDCAACGGTHGYTRCPNYGGVSATRTWGLGGQVVCRQFQRHVGREGIDWVIVGAESGPRVRPTDPAWVRALRDQCQAAGVAFFFKQWGGRTAKAGGRILDGRTWDEMPEGSI